MIHKRHTHRRHRDHRHALWESTLAACLFAFLLLYILLEKKCLPRSWWAPLSSFYFWPMAMPRLLWRMATGAKYFTDIDETVLLGAAPMVIAGHVRELHTEGVRAVVNLQAEWRGPTAAYAALDPPIEQLWIPVVDHTELTVMQLEQAVAFITSHHQRGERVLVHCKGGHGRSAAAVMAWLVSESGGGLTPQDAQRHLSSLRAVREHLDTQASILEFAARHLAVQTETGPVEERRLDETDG